VSAVVWIAWSSFGRLFVPSWHDFDIRGWPLWRQSCLSQWPLCGEWSVWPLSGCYDHAALRIPPSCAWLLVGIPHSVTSALRNVGLHVKCSLLYDLNLNWNLSTNFSKIAEYKIFWKLVKLFSSRYMHTDRTGEPSRHVFANFVCEYAKNETKYNVNYPNSVYFENNRPHLFRRYFNFSCTFRYSGVVHLRYRGVPKFYASGTLQTSLYSAVRWQTFQIFLRMRYNCAKILYKWNPDAYFMHCNTAEPVSTVSRLLEAYSLP
jgi:hypothetical protein